MEKNVVIGGKIYDDRGVVVGTGYEGRPLRRGFLVFSTFMMGARPAYRRCS